MSWFSRYRTPIQHIVRSLLFMSIGALILLAYIDFTQPVVSRQVRHIGDAIYWIFLTLILIKSWLDRHDQTARPDPSPAMSGTITVLLTGAAFAFAVKKSAVFGGGFGPMMIVLACTLGASILVWVFASRHKENIGEARFNTTGA
ncbi:hypothetical protein [Sphingobium yanoikuyae]|uniref:Uncharacterized protein n=1 Tax=Sphingobium yanoikuyae TaxID=13690 RepID=A0A291N0Z8_SPHYA|nr:hypothetical protein [Sphingobium yanoikuyae]ATI81033.1 hypothetical protein A6768_14295 [Sphingobium yanoikuyae]